MSIKRTAARTIAASAAFVVISFGFNGLASAAPNETCPEGAAVATVMDDNGNAQQACVAVEAASFAGPARTASSGAGSLPSTGATTNGALIAAGLVMAGTAASLASRRRA